MGNIFLNIRNKFRLLKSDLPVLFMAYRDKRTPVASKLITALPFVYLFSPIDILPDVIPVLGLVDDLFILPFLVSLAMKTVPAAVIADARLKLGKTKSTVKYVLLVVIIIACAVGAYCTYQYFNQADY